MAGLGVSGAFVSVMAADANDAESDMRFAVLRVSRLLRHCTSAMMTCETPQPLNTVQCSRQPSMLRCPEVSNTCRALLIAFAS